MTEPGFFKSEITNDIPAKTLRMMYETMQGICKFEERVAERVSKNEIICPCHLYIGEEALATGVCAALRKDDYGFSTHCSAGHYIAKRGDVKALMAELYCRATGCSRGRGGPMHKHESLGLGYFRLPKTEQISTELLSLPMYPEKHQLLRRKLK